MESTQDPIDPQAAQCRRTAFLEALLHDQERGRLAPIDDYLGRFPDIAAFVRTEYRAFAEVTDAPSTADDPDLPENCGRYRLTRRLGEGGMGVVHEALDTELHRRVVIKTLRPTVATNPEARERLRREARVLGRLEHANLAKVIDLFEIDGRMHLVMPYHDGRTLAQCIEEARTQSEPSLGGAAMPPALGANGSLADRAQRLRQILGFFVRAAQALHSAHRAGIVHRDLKPQNLMVAPDGTPVVLDFGLALPDGDERLTVAGELMGTPLYMAPEQIEGQCADVRTDVHSLGVTLYETTTLLHPFAGPGRRDAVFQRILAGDPVPPRRHQPLLSRDLEAVVLRAIDRQPRRRYPDMDAFARDLQRVLDLEPTEARPVTALDIALRRVRRRPFVSLLAVVAVVAVGIAIWMQWRIDAIKDDVRELRFDRALQRSLEANGPGLHLFYPQGLVASGQQFVWSGTPARDPELPHIVQRYTFRVEVLDGEQCVASWNFPQPVDSLVCACELPAEVTLERGRAYCWRVRLAGHAVDDEPGHDPVKLAECRSVTFAEVQELLPVVTQKFSILAEPAPALEPDFGTLEARVRSLLGQRLAADAMLLLLVGSIGDEDTGLAPARRIELIEAVCAALGDDALLRPALQVAGRPQ